jgi:peptide/nickel transport system substrate-binding protein
VARALVLAAAIAASLLAVSGSGGAATQQTPKRGGTIVLLRPATTEPACLNPFACAAQIDPSVMQVLEGAFEVDSDLVVRPNLITHVTIGRKPFTLTYHVRPEARWSDRTPVTASDLLFTQRALARRAMPGDPGGAIRALHRTIRRARVLGPRTFQVELREPFAAWRNLYPIVLPHHVLKGRDLSNVWIDRIDDPRTGAPIGTGPFLVGRWERGKQLTLVRNDRYWGSHTAYLDRFVHRFTTPDPGDPLAPIRRNEFDVAISLGAGFISREVAQQVRQTPGWRVATWPTLAMEHLAFRVGEGGHPALREKLVRRALAFAIDRVAITRAIQVEADESMRRPLDSAVFLPTEQVYSPNWRGYRYDPRRAQQLLTQAGCRRGSDGIYECAGARLRLRLATTPEPVRAQVLELVRAQLRPVGVEIVPLFVPGSAFFGQVLPGGDFDIALFAWLGSGGFVWPEAQCGHVQNWTGFCSRLLMRDAQQVDLIVDPRQRARVLNAVDAKLARAVPALPVVQPVLRAAIRSTVRGVEPGGTQFHFSQNSENWWLAEPR